MDRRLAAILAADVVGYSRLMAADEAGTHARLKALREGFVEPTITERRGRIVKLMGDGLLAEFASVVDAVACAVAIQAGVAERQAEIAEDRRIVLRIGINIGDVITEADDIYGDGVNVAARLEGLAEPGGICVSRTVYEHARGKVDVAFAPAGTHQVKNIPEPVEVYRLLDSTDAPTVEPRPLAGAQRAAPARLRLPALVAAVLLVLAVSGAIAWWQPWAPAAQDDMAPPLSDQPSIAVLPFDDFSGDVRQQRLAAAFAEDLITELARFRDLLVIARNSSFAYQGRQVDAREVGKELGVHYLLEGSLQIDPDRVRVTTQLIDAVDGTHLWSERYDRPAEDFFAVRDEVVGQIVGTLMGYSGPLANAGLEAARRKGPESLQAYDYFLLSKEPYIRHDAEGMAEARKLVEQAIELDPGLPRAWELLAWTYYRDAFGGWGDDPEGSWQAFHETAREAAARSPTDGGVHVVLGMSHFTKGEFEQGAAAWDRALALSPNDANVLRPVGALFAIGLGLERADEGLELAERAMRLDPLHPAIVASAVGFAAYFAEEYEKAIEAFRKRPNKSWDHRTYMAASYAQLGQLDDAHDQVAEVLRLKPDFDAESYVDMEFFQPGGDSAALFFDGARKAGLPLCAEVAVAATLDPRNLLPECDAERAKG